MTTEPMVSSPGGPPVRFDVESSESLSRILIFVKWLLWIPHYIILYLLSYIVLVITVIAFFAILFTKKYPRGMHNFVVGVARWNANAYAYVLLLRDEYPPFSWEPGKYPVSFEIDYPEDLSRWAPLYKWLLVIPNLLVLFIVMIIAILLIVIGWFAILFTGRLPRGIHDFIEGTMRWYARVYAYVYLLRDEYPPFSMK
ncbi:MAG TPA: DUF4389 domain-containing protein [Dehalococcoidia bacterium]|nr:DUF4389 domain-containing protein [Dehalococcoidia bacterium]